MSSFLCTLVGIALIKAETQTCSQNETCACSNDEACRLECIGDEQCQGTNTTLQCTENYPCVIICDGNGKKSACTDAYISGNGATNVTLICNDELSCQRTTMDCDTATECTTQCSDKLGCSFMHIYCGESICALSCSSQNTCSDLTVDATNASRFDCQGKCTHYGIPDSFTMSPTTHPTPISLSPSFNPTTAPTIITTSPTMFTMLPTTSPTRYPTINPTAYPTIEPSEYPSVDPSTYPTINPSIYPTINPSIYPTINPTTHNPSIAPSIKNQVLKIHLDAITTQQGAISHGVMDTTQAYNEGVDNRKSNAELSTQLWIYPLVSGIVLLVAICCLVFAVVIWYRHTTRRIASYFTQDRLKIHTQQQPEFIDQPTPMSVASDSVTVNDSKGPIRQALMNNVSDMVMDDIMNDLTQGNDNYVVHRKDTNPMQEGGDHDIINDINDINDLDDAILNDIMDIVTKGGSIGSVDEINSKIFAAAIESNKDMQIMDDINDMNDMTTAGGDASRSDVKIINIASMESKVDDDNVLHEIENEMVTIAGDDDNSYEMENDDDVMNEMITDCGDENVVGQINHAINNEK